MGAYLFDGTDDVLNADVAITVGATTIFAVFRADGVTQDDTLVALHDKAQTTTRNIRQLSAAGAVGGDPVAAAEGTSTGSFAQANSTAGFTAATWHTGAAVWVTTTDKRAFLDGANKGTNATNRAPSLLDRISVGAWDNAQAGLLSAFAGRIAYVFIWNIALSDAEVATMHGGTVPQQASLIHAYDLTQDHGAGPVPDFVGSADLTITGATYDGAATPSPTYDSYFAVGVAPENTVAPAITGNPWVGQTLTDTDGTWTGTPAPTITKQWQREDAVGSGTYADIAGETGDTYTLVNADRVRKIRVKETATNASGSADAFSAATVEIGTASELVQQWEWQVDLVSSYAIQGGPAAQRLQIGIGIGV